MPSDSQIANTLFKNKLNKAYSDQDAAFFSEPRPYYAPVFSGQIWAQSDLIPSSAPILSNEEIDGTGTVQYFEKLALTPLPGAVAQGFYHDNLRNVLPIAHGGDANYNYKIYKTDGTTEISLLVTGAVIDASGVLVFYNGIPSGVDKDNPPKVSFYRYVGAFGAGSNDVDANDFRISDHVDPDNKIAFSTTALSGVRTITMADRDIDLQYVPAQSVETTATPTFTGVYAKDSSSANTVLIQAPTLSSTLTLTLPNNTGSSGQVLSTNGSGLLSWTNNTETADFSSDVFRISDATVGTKKIQFNLSGIVSGPKTLTISDNVDLQYVPNQNVTTTASPTFGHLLLTDIANTGATTPSAGYHTLFYSSDDERVKIKGIGPTYTDVGGIATLGGLTTVSQSFSTSTAGPTFAVSSVDSTHTINVPLADETTEGLMSTGTQTFAGTKTMTLYFDDSTAELGTNTMQGAVDNIMTTYIQKLVPTAPAKLDTKTISLSGAISAREAGTGTLFTGNVFVNVDPTTTNADAFLDTQTGFLSAFLDTVETGQLPLTTGDDTNIDSALQILSNPDAYEGQTGKEGFWWQLTARCTYAKANFSAGTSAHTFKIELNDGTNPAYGTNIVTFYYDADPGAPTISNASITSLPIPTTKISGVLSYETGNAVEFTHTCNNCVGYFYNSSGNVRVSDVYVGDSGWLEPSSVPAANSSFINVVTRNIAATGRYSETMTFTLYARDTDGTSTSSNISTYDDGSNGVAAMRIDTTSINIGEASIRNSAGTGQFPSEGTYGGAYDSNASLTTTEDLQLIGGIIRYPTINFSTYYPWGNPNYSAISGMRYYCRKSAFTLGVGTASINIGFSSSLGGTFGTSNFECWLIFLDGGGIRQCNWINCNAAYEDGSNLSLSYADGVFPAVNTGGSTNTTRNIVYGTTRFNGCYAYVRVGINESSALTFPSPFITLSL